MTNSQISNLMAVPITLVCFVIAVRAFYIYRLSRSNMLFILGLSMTMIFVGTSIGFLSELHIGGIVFTPEWARTFCACCGGLFLFFSALVHTPQQMERLKQWQIGVGVLCLIVIALTPLYRPVPNVQVSLLLTSARMIIYTCAFIRYAALYMRKSTRFSLIMGLAFIVLVIGYSLNIPGIVDSHFAYFSIIAASVRIVAYVSLLVAYSLR